MWLRFKLINSIKSTVVNGDQTRLITDLSNIKGRIKITMLNGVTEPIDDRGDGQIN